MTYKPQDTIGIVSKDKRFEDFWDFDHVGFRAPRPQEDESFEAYVERCEHKLRRLINPKFNFYVADVTWQRHYEKGVA